MSSPNIIGPIDYDTSFFITTIYNNSPYILSSAPRQNQVVYFWLDPSSPTGPTGTYIGVFNSSQNNIINDTSTPFVSGISINNGTLINTLSPTSVLITQSIYSNWWPPVAFLSNVKYKIENVKIPIGSVEGQLLDADNMYILSTSWFFDCKSDGTYFYIDTIQKVLTNWVCNVKGTIPACQNFQVVPSGFTTIDQCQNGINFSYCPVPKNCGDSNCNGPCSESWYDCDLRQNNFVCVFNPSKYISQAKWWENPIIIGGAILFLVIIAIILVVIISISRKISQ